MTAFLRIVTAISLVTFCPSFAFASDSSAVGSFTGGPLYAVTHMSPLIYWILLSICILSAMNLMYQARFTVFGALAGTGRHKPQETAKGGKAPPFRKDDYSASLFPHRVPPFPPEAGSTPSWDISNLMLTPLDGVNHSLPELGVSENPDGFQSVDRVSSSLSFQRGINPIAAPGAVDFAEVGCIVRATIDSYGFPANYTISNLPNILPDLQLCMECIGFDNGLKSFGQEIRQGGLMMPAKKKQPVPKQTKKTKKEAVVEPTPQAQTDGGLVTATQDLSGRVARIDALIEAGDKGDFSGRVPQARNEHHCKWAALLEEDIALRKQIVTLKEKENALLGMIRDRVAENLIDTADQATEQGLLKQPES